jgi:cell division protease FtsH
MTSNEPPDPRGPDEKAAARRPWIAAAVLAALTLGALLLSNIRQTNPSRIDYSVFYDLVDQGKVESVVLLGRDVRGDFTSKQKVGNRELASFTTVTPERDDALVPLLREKKVHITVEDDREGLGFGLLSGVAPWILFAAVWFWFARRAQRTMGSGGPLGGLMKGRANKFDVTKQVKTTMDDVAGSKAAKRDLQEVVGFLKEPNRFKRLGGRVPRGVLLVGPPGTGKTLLARAVAGESNVPFYSISGSEFIEMFVGVGAGRVRELFAEAKKNPASIIFIDEIDAVGRARGTGLGGGNDEREQTLNQLLSEMDGFSRNDLVVVIAATNRPDVLDSALLRPGRFDRRVVVDRPELEARRAILAVHVKHKPLADDVDLESIARNTPGFSGADLSNLVNEAALGATRRGADNIAAVDFTAAYDKIVLGDLRESKLDAKEKHRVAVHESGHAVVTHFSEHAEPLHRVSIIPRGMALGVTQQTPSADRHIMTEPELESRLNVLMGGYAAEREVLGQVSTGAENDLKEATKIATQMVAHYGMSKELGAVYYDHESEHAFLGQRIATESGSSDQTIFAIEREARSILVRALASATAVVQARRAALDKLVDALLEFETLDQAELVRLLG